MAKITIKPLSKNDPIFTKSFMTFSKYTNKRRKYENTTYNDIHPNTFN